VEHTIPSVYILFVYTHVSTFGFNQLYKHTYLRMDLSTSFGARK